MDSALIKWPAISPNILRYKHTLMPSSLFYKAHKKPTNKKKGGGQNWIARTGRTYQVNKTDTLKHSWKHNGNSENMPLTDRCQQELKTSDWHNSQNQQPPNSKQSRIYIFSSFRMLIFYYSFLPFIKMQQIWKRTLSDQQVFLNRFLPIV